jgi:hypothetical protein
MNLKEYKYTTKHKKGITDLINIYAFLGNSQGDTSATNSVEEYKAAKGWLSYAFDKSIDCNDQEAINKESLRRQKENEITINKLKESGEYSQEYESTITILMGNRPLFDNAELFKE